MVRLTARPQAGLASPRPLESLGHASLAPPSGIAARRIRSHRRRSGRAPRPVQRKSITGGFVYRGRAIPELAGAYLYGDFVSGRLWALKLDLATGKATNVKLPWSGLPVYGFGSDADGEAYVLTSSPTGQGVFRLAPAPQAAAR